MGPASASALAQDPAPPGPATLATTPGCPFDAANAVLGIPLRQPVAEAPVRLRADTDTGLASWEPLAPVSVGDLTLPPSAVTLYYSPTWLYQVNVRPGDPAALEHLRTTLEALCGPPSRTVDGTSIWTTGRVVTQWRSSPPELAGAYISVYDG